MNKPSLRQNILFGSVQRLLDENEKVRSTVVMSTHHRWLLPYALVSGIALFLVASATQVEPLASRIMIGGCGAAIAALATTNHWVLAETTHGLLLCRSSRIRQYAKEIVRRLPDDAPLTMVGSTLINSDWNVDGVTYSLTKRWESTMRRLSMTTD